MSTHRQRLESRPLPLTLVGFAILFATVSGCNYMSGHTANQMGKARYKMGNYSDAYYEFRRAVIDHPQNADFHHNLAASLNKQGNLVEAEKSYKQALQLDPAHQPSYHALARLMKDQGRVAEAKDLLHAWVDTQPYNAGSHIETAWLHRETGDIAAAEKSLKTALEVKPNHPIALAQLGQIYQETGQTDRAIAVYQRSLHNHWQQPQVRSRLAALRGLYAPNARPRFAGLPSIFRPYSGSLNRYGSLPPFGTYGQMRYPTGIAQGSILSPSNTIALEPVPMDSSLIPNADPAHSSALGSETTEGDGSIR